MKVQGLVPPCTSISRGTGLSGTASYRLVPNFTASYRLVPPRIQKRTGRYERNQNLRKCQYVPVHTCTSQFILTHTSHVKVDQFIRLYWYVLVHTSTDKYRQVHTGMYWLVLVCTSTCQEFLDSKKVQTGFEPVILCILFVYSTAALRVHSK